MADDSNTGCAQAIGGLVMLGAIVGFIIAFWEYIVAVLVGILILVCAWLLCFGRGARQRRLEKRRESLRLTRAKSRAVAEGLARNWQCDTDAKEVDAYADQVLAEAAVDFHDEAAVAAFREEWGLDAMKSADSNA